MQWSHSMIRFQRGGGGGVVVSGGSRERNETGAMSGGEQHCLVIGFDLEV